MRLNADLNGPRVHRRTSAPLRTNAVQGTLQNLCKILRVLLKRQ